MAKTPRHRGRAGILGRAASGVARQRKYPVGALRARRATKTLTHRSSPRFKTILALALASAAATELTPETWDDAVDGKTIFVKFLAPW
jgi:hypothetical protein